MQYAVYPEPNLKNRTWNTYPEYTACIYTLDVFSLLKGLNEKNPLTSAVSGERYFYLWPRFSIKYWRWTSKDSLDDIKAEWWLCWSLKWHSAVWRGMGSMICKSSSFSALQTALCTTEWFLLGIKGLAAVLRAVITDNKRSHSGWIRSLKWK